MKTMKKIALLSFVILMSVMLNGNTLIDVCADGEEKRQANIETEENTTLKQNREKDWQNVIKTEQDNKNSQTHIEDSERNFDNKQPNSEGYRSEYKGTVKTEDNEGDADKHKQDAEKPSKSKGQTAETEVQTATSEKMKFPGIDLFQGVNLLRTPRRGPLEKTDVNITEFSIKDENGTTATSFIWYQNIRLHVAWDAGVYSNTLKEGDYFYITMPEQCKFPANVAATDFDIFSIEDPSIVVAKGKVTPLPDGGGTVKVTFTNYVENRYNIGGTVELAASFLKKKVKIGEINTFVASIAGKIKETQAEIKEPDSPPGDENVKKWPLPSVDGSGNIVEDEVKWQVRINFNKKSFNNVVFEDELSVYSGGTFDGLKYIEGSFELWKVKYRPDGIPEQFLESINDINSKVVFLNPEKTKFRINFGSIDGDQYFLQYKSTYKPGLKIRNKFHFKADGKNDITISEYISASSGGQGHGDLLSRIKIIKVDEEGNTIKLPGAQFKITRKSDNSTFTLTTDANGEVVSDKLVPGEYTIEEITPPPGYLKDNKKYTVTVRPDEVIVMNIKNKRVPWIPPPPPTPGTDYIDLKVKKDWEDSSGKKADAPVKSIKVRLYRNGTATDKMLELNESNKWEGTFQRLEKYVVGTSTPYEYTVQEEGAVNGKIVFDGKEFKVQVEGTMKDGYRIINKKDNPPPDVPKDEKISISVIKKWIGEEKDSITVHLLLNGKEIRSKVITKQDGWKYTFENLDKYVDGKLAEYIVKEDKVDGYVTTVTGKGEEGFVITNRKNTTPPPPSTPPTPKVPTPKRFLPKTGDGLNPMEKVVALMLIGAMLMLVGMKRRTNKNNSTN